MKKILRFTVALGAVAAVCVCGGLWLMPYDTFVAYLAAFLGYADRIERFKTIGFTAEMYARLRVLWVSYACLASGGWLVAERYKWAFTATLQGFFQDAMRRMWQLLRCVGRSTPEKTTWALVLLGIVASRFFFIAYLPLHIDEIHNYLYFTSKGLLVSLSYYQEPNNHIFYTLITVFLDALTDDVKIMMRLPSLLAHFVTVLLLGRLLASYTSFSATLLGVIWFSFSDLSVYYSSIGRGYALQIGWVLVAFYAVLRMRSNPWAMYYFVTSSVLGFYTIPTFLYAFFALVVLLAWRTRSLLTVFYSVFLTGVITFLLYSPVIALNGWEALVHNRWVQSWSGAAWLAHFPIHWAEWQRDIWNVYHFWGFVPVLWVAALLLLAMKKQSARNKVFTQAVLGAYWLPFVVLFLQWTLPPTRVWTFLTLFAAMSVALMFEWLTTARERTQKWSAILLVSLLLLRCGFRFYEFFTQEIGIYQTVAAQIEPIVFAQKPQHIFSNEDVSIMYLLLSVHQQKINAQLHTHQIDSLQRYDIWILDKQKHVPPFVEKLNTIYEDKWIQVKTRQ